MEAFKDFSDSPFHHLSLHIRLFSEFNCFSDGFQPTISKTKCNIYRLFSDIHLKLRHIFDEIQMKFWHSGASVSQLGYATKDFKLYSKCICTPW